MYDLRGTIAIRQIKDYLYEHYEDQGHQPGTTTTYVFKAAADVLIDCQDIFNTLQALFGTFGSSFSIYLLVPVEKIDRAALVEHTLQKFLTRVAIFLPTSFLVCIRHCLTNLYPIIKWGRAQWGAGRCDSNRQAFCLENHKNLSFV